MNIFLVKCSDAQSQSFVVIITCESTKFNYISHRANCPGDSWSYDPGGPYYENVRTVLSDERSCEDVQWP